MIKILGELHVKPEQVALYSYCVKNKKIAYKDVFDWCKKTKKYKGLTASEIQHVVVTARNHFIEPVRLQGLDKKYNASDNG